MAKEKQTENAKPEPRKKAASGPKPGAINIPKNVIFCIERLREKGFEAYIVGGCTRDYLLQIEPSDWDIATNAFPENIEQVFGSAGIKTFYENIFGTVGVAFPKSKKAEPEYEIIEITTYRSESSYSDARHPDKVEWSKTIDEDLKRRDFTINAIALSPIAGKKEMEIVDLFNGQDDLRDKIIRAVGNPNERFGEDALRMMRAIRFKTTLGQGWTIEPETMEAIIANSALLKKISFERIRDEFIKIINSKNAANGIEFLRLTGLLKHIIPELEEGYGVMQNKHHVYDCYTHNVECLNYAAQKGFNTHIRVAALLHDIGKPRTKHGTGKDATFYNHEIVSARMADKILTRLRFPKKDADKILKLVRYHLFYYNIDEVGESSIRRLLRNVGQENIEDLLKIRMADRIGSGCPKAEPYKLRHLKYMIDKVSQDPISVKMLKANGEDIMKLLKIEPGPKIGQILDILLEEVLKEPKQNTKKYLTDKIKELGQMNEQTLKELALKAKQSINKTEVKKDEMTKEKYWVS
ncbi:MAG: HD domain-containing protein [Candidatus Paceibacterota bacterium]